MQAVKALSESLAQHRAQIDEEIASFQAIVVASLASQKPPCACACDGQGTQARPRSRHGHVVTLDHEMLSAPGMRDGERDHTSFANPRQGHELLVGEILMSCLSLLGIILLLSISFLLVF